MSDRKSKRSINSGQEAPLLSESTNHHSTAPDPGFGRREFLLGAASLATLYWPGSALALTPMPPVLFGAPAPPIPPNPGGGFGPVNMDIVPADRRTVWNPGIYGGIPPDNAVLGTFPNGVGPATQHGSTLTPSGGDDRGQISSALSAAGR